MKRRTFLAWLGLAPVAVTVAKLPTAPLPAEPTSVIGQPFPKNNGLTTTTTIEEILNSEWIEPMFTEYDWDLGSSAKWTLGLG